MLDWFNTQTAGLWPLVWHYSAGLGVTGAALAFAWFSPVLKKTALWVALGSLIITTSYGIGVSNGSARTQAQWDAANKATISKSKKARANADRTIRDAVPDELRNDPDNRDND